MKQDIALRRIVGPMIAVAAVALAAATGGEAAQGAKKSDAVVKVTAAAGEPGVDGKQAVTLTLEIEKPWHLYANPVPADFPGIPTTVTFSAKDKIENVRVDYPPGKPVKDAIVGDHQVYEDKVTIKATVQRAKGDTTPLEVSIKLQACTDKQCLLPGMVKLTVPAGK